MSCALEMPVPLDGFGCGLPSPQARCVKWPPKRTLEGDLLQESLLASAVNVLECFALATSSSVPGRRQTMHSAPRRSAASNRRPRQVSQLWTSSTLVGEGVNWRTATPGLIRRDSSPPSPASPLRTKGHAY